MKFSPFELVVIVIGLSVCLGFVISSISTRRIRQDIAQATAKRETWVIFDRLEDEKPTQFASRVLRSYQLGNGCIIRDLPDDYLMRLINLGLLALPGIKYEPLQKKRYTLRACI